MIVPNKKLAWWRGKTTDKALQVIGVLLIFSLMGFLLLATFESQGAARETFMQIGGLACFLPLIVWGIALAIRDRALIKAQIKDDTEMEQMIETRYADILQYGREAGFTFIHMPSHWCCGRTVYEVSKSNDTTYKYNWKYCVCCLRNTSSKDRVHSPSLPEALVLGLPPEAVDAQKNAINECLAMAVYERDLVEKRCQRLMDLRDALNATGQQPFRVSDTVMQDAELREEEFLEDETPLKTPRKTMAKGPS